MDRKYFCYLGLLCSSIIFIIMLCYVWNFTVDDAFISFRYSENLANGFGLVWNIGETPLEGYSNFLWVLIVSFVLLFKLDPTFMTKIIGILSLLGIITLFWLISEEIQGKKSYLGFSLGVVLLLINPATAIHTVSGLETMTYAFLILLNIYLVCKIIFTSSKKLTWFFSITALALSLLRLEGILISIGLVLVLLFMNYREKKTKKCIIDILLPFTISYAIPLTMYMIFRVYYFNELFPMVFLVKTLARGDIFAGSHVSDMVSVGVYLLPFVVIILVSLLMSGAFGRLINTNNKFKVLLCFSLVAILFGNIVYLPSELMMNYSQRFFYPSFIIVYIISGIALSIILQNIQLKNSSISYGNIFKPVFGILVILLLLSSNYEFVEGLKAEHEYGENLERAHIAVGNSLNDFSYSNYTIANADAGAIPYFSKWHHLDIWGLNDKFIAKNKVATFEYVNDKHPDLVIFTTENRNQNYNFTSPNNKPFFDFVTKNNYVRLTPIKFRDDYYLIPYLNTQIEDFEEIKDSLERM